MTAVFIDSNGIKRNFLWQYDKNQTLVLENLDYDIAPEVHFATSAFNEAFVATDIVYNNGRLEVLVPDVLLSEARKITVYLYVNGNVGETVQTLDIFVRPRKKPSDYIYNDEMYVMGIGTLSQAIANYIDTHLELVEDVVVDYTTVILTDDATGVQYMVGINDSKLYIKEVS